MLPPITTSTYASLQLQGITGVLYVGLTTKTLGAPSLKAKEGEKYPIIPTQPSLLLQLSQAIPSITKNVEIIGDRINRLLNEQNQESIKSTLQHLSVFSKTLSDNANNLTESLKLLRTTLNNTATASAKLPQITNQFNNTLTSLQGASKSISQVTPSAQQLFNTLNVVGTNLQQFTTELQRNPSMIIRGRQLPPAGPGE